MWDSPLKPQCDQQSERLKSLGWMDVSHGEAQESCESWG